MESRRALTFEESVERGLRLVIGIVILAKTTVFALQVATRPDLDAESLLLALAVVLAVGTAAVLCLRGRAPMLAVGLATCALVAGALIPRDGVPVSGSAESPILHLVEPMLLAIAARGRAAIPLIASLAVLFVGLRGLTAGDEWRDGLVAGLEEAALITGSALGALVLVMQMRAASARAEAAIRHEQHTRESQPGRAQVEAVAYLHDEVIPALLAVHGNPVSERTRIASATTLGGLSGPPPLSDELVTGRITALADSAGVDADVVLEGRPTRFPPEVSEAFHGAIGEALRNVARHSGQRQAQVTIRRRPGHLHATVSDHGSGFAGSPGVGLRVAVLARVKAVGGTATVDGRPGSGTTVQLEWRARRANPLGRALGNRSEADRLVRLAVGPPARPAMRPVVALAAGYLVTAVLIGLRGDPQAATYAGAAVVAAGLVLLARRMQRGPLSVLHLAAATILPSAILVAVLPTVSAEGLGGVESWIIEFTALPALATAWLVPARVVLLMLVPNAVAIGAAANDVGVAAADLPHLLFVQPLNALFVAVIVSVCRRAGRVVDANDAPSRDEQRAAAVQGLLGNRLARVQAALAANAAGGSAEDDPALLARAVRDCLYVPGEANAGLRAALDELRRSGVEVETMFRAEPDDPVNMTKALRAMVGATSHRVTLATGAERWSIVVVPGLTGAPLERLIEVVAKTTWALEPDDDATAITAVCGRVALIP